MAQVIISQLPPLPSGTGSGSSKGTDLFPATDTTATTGPNAGPGGTTNKYTLAEIYNFMLSAQGLTTYSAVRVATVLALTTVYDNGTLGVGATLTNAGAQAAIAIDGVTLSLADRVLVKNQAAQADNGIYIVTTLGSSTTNWVLTRATDYDLAADIVQYGVVLSNQGTTNAGILWQETGAGPWTMGTTPIIFAAYNASFASNAVLLDPTGNQTILNAYNLIMDVGSMVAPTMLPGNLSLSGNILSSTDSNGNIDLMPNGTGHVIINSSTPISSNSNALDLVSESNVAYFQTAAYFNNVSGCAWYGYHSKSSVQGIFSPLVNNDQIIRILALGDDGSAFQASSQITFYVDGSVSSGIVPGKIILSTANSSGVMTTGLTINASQQLILANPLLPASGGLGTGTAPSAGQIPIGTSGNVYTPAAINSGTGIVVANGSGSITISATGGGISWSTSSGTTVSAAINNGYITGNAGVTTVTLPTTAAIGSVVAVEGLGAAGWVLAASAGDTIQIGASATSSGGTLTSAAATDNVYVTCIVADSVWRVRSTNSTGLTVA